MGRGFQKCSLFTSFKLLLKVTDIMLRYECHWLIYFLFCGKKVLFMDSRDVCRKRHVKLLVRHNLIMSTVKNLHWKMISYNKVANKNTIHKIAHHKSFYAFRNWQFILFFPDEKYIWLMLPLPNLIILYPCPNTSFICKLFTIR